MKHHKYVADNLKKVLVELRRKKPGFDSMCSSKDGETLFGKAIHTHVFREVLLSRAKQQRITALCQMLYGTLVSH